MEIMPGNHEDVLQAPIRLHVASLSRWRLLISPKLLPRSVSGVLFPSTAAILGEWENTLLFE